ncbi:APC family permease [Anaerotignum sp. MB30-C6]|uniref:APC family permease n=1 Tax=Anaerotignum sp. MB30-C6 TaxID=3070814 RepID=UPI0027DD93F8|nr:APC family permease [Anaerotignum sp. MB30-C6]WMI80476.1 APC family permease [Anaerotignum sp. MB30-C6]
MSGNQQQQEGAFKKDLRKIDIWSLALGAIIGWGCFVMPGTSFLPKAGPIGSIIGMMLGAVIMCIICVSYGYMIRKFPLSGGEFVYADAAFGKKHAFICGWFIVLAYWSLIPLNSTALAMISRYILPGSPLQIGYLYTIAGWDIYLGEIALAYAFIIGLGIVNMRGIKSAGWFQTLVAVSLFASVMFALIGVLLTKPDFGNLQPLFLEGQSKFSGVLAVLAFAPYCFVGFDCIPQAAEEYSFSHKAALGLMVTAILIGGIIYSAVIFITAVVDPWGPMLASNPDWATGEMVMKSIGYIGVVFIGIAMLCAVVASMNGFYIASSRLLYSMAYADALPQKFAHLTPQGTPKNGILFMMVLALIAPWFGRQVLAWIVDMTCVGAAMGFTYTCAAAAKIARRDGDKLQMWISALGIAVASIFLIITFIPGMPGFLSIPSFIILGIWTVLGIIFFLIIKSRYIYGQWKGISVEQILYTKMKDDGKL